MARKAEHNHELNELPYSSSVRLLGVESPKVRPAPPLNESNSKSRVFLKHLGLQLPDTLVGTVFAWRSSKEHRKIAIHKSRSMAALNSLLHLVPTSACIALLVLFWLKVWTGGPSDNATTLQFVAKFHELLMQSSLVTILLHIIRSQAINGFIPLGALSGAIKGPQISYLWSLDFFSAIMSSEFGAGRKVAFALSTLGLLFMTGVVGPSSAVLMIPRPGMPYERFKGKYYTNASELETFPSSFNYTHKLNFSTFDQLNYSQILEFYGDGVGFSFTSAILADVFRTRTMKEIRSLVSPELGYYQTIATIPTILSKTQLDLQLSDSRGQVFGYGNEAVANATVAITTLQPVTLVTCAPFPSSKNEDVYYPLHNGTGRFLSTAADMYKRMSDGAEPPPLWVPSPEDPASLIGIFHPKLTSHKNSFATCTVTPFWWRTKAWRSAGLNKIIYIDLPPREHVSKQSGFTPITIATDGITAINSAAWLKNVALLDGQSASSSVIAQLFVSAISQFPGRDPDYNEDIDGWDRYPCCDGKYLGGFEAPKIAQGNHAHFEFTATSYGYGYGATNTSIRLSVAVITTYCIIALLYVIYIIATGHTSAAWDTATELIVLALQSKEPKDLGCVSAGLDSTETLRKGVGIRVSTVKDNETGDSKERLELVFDEEETEKRGLTKVVRGNAY